MCAVAAIVAVVLQCGKADIACDGRVVHAAICSGATEGLGHCPAGKFSRATGKAGHFCKRANRRRAGRRFAGSPEVASCLNPLTGFHLAVMSPSPSESIDSSATSSARCPRCRRVFDCGARGGREACWCVSMPAMPTEALDAGTGCLCPECLADAIARTRAMEGSAAPAPD
jgi:hypothetical protein